MKDAKWHFCLAMAGICGGHPMAQSAGDSGWVDLWNGKDFSNGIFFQIGGRPVMENPNNTIKIENGMLHVDPPVHVGFGAIGTPREYAYYHVRVEYKFGARPLPSGYPDWAKGNNGVLIHGANTPFSGFPFSWELQLHTGNTGTLIPFEGLEGTVYNANGTTRPVKHPTQLPAKTHPLKDSAWVRFEAIVLGDSLVTEIVDGDTVMRFGKLRYSADQRPLGKGRVYLQEEGQDTWFRLWQIRELNRDGTPLKPSAILNLASPARRVSRFRPFPSPLLSGAPAREGFRPIRVTADGRRGASGFP